MTRIPIGELVEWLGALALVAAAALWSGTVLALAVAGAWLLYAAQCIAAGDNTITIGTDKEKT